MRSVGRGFSNAYLQPPQATVNGDAPAASTDDVNKEGAKSDMGGIMIQQPTRQTDAPSNNKMPARFANQSGGLTTLSGGSIDSDLSKIMNTLNANKGDDQFDPVRQKIADYQQQLADQKKMNAYSALAQAGFGMAASPSPYAAQAIGEGGLTGLKAYDALQQQNNADQQTGLGLQERLGESEESRQQNRLQTAATMYDALSRNRMMAPYYEARANNYGGQGNDRNITALVAASKAWDADPRNFGKPFPYQSQLDAAMSTMGNSYGNMANQPNQANQPDPLGIR
jgi:hypothetical protein